MPDSDRLKLRCRLGWHLYTSIPQNVIQSMRLAGEAKHPPMGFGSGGYFGPPGPLTCFYCGEAKPRNWNPHDMSPEAGFDVPDWLFVVGCLALVLLIVLGIVL